MRLTEGGSLAVSLLFMLLVVTMVFVDQVLELANFVFQLDCPDLGIV